MRKNRHKAQLSVGKIKADATVPIVADAAIATGGVGEGRLIPLVIIDTANHQHIEDLVKAHDSLSPGDAEITWGWQAGSKDSISLIIDFKKPIETTIHLIFDIAHQGGLVDLIMNSKALYLQPGRQGDRLKNTMDNPRIIIEIPDTGFQCIWIDKWKKTTSKQLRNQGLSRREARKASQELIDRLRETFSFRFK